MTYRTLAMCLLVGCQIDGGPGVDNPVPGDPNGQEVEHGNLLGIAIRPNDPTLAAGDEVGLIVKAYYDSDTSEVLSEGITWVSTDERVASVGADGMVKALQVGTADVVATEPSGFSAKVSVNVLDASARLSELSLLPSAFEVPVGVSTQLTPSGTYSDGSSGGVSGCTFSTSDSSVLTVDETGQVMAEGEGEATVQASCGGMTAISTVTVLPEDAEVGLCDLVFDLVEVDVYGSEAWIWVEVRNAGDALCPADASWVDLYLDPSWPLGTVGDDYAALLALAPGDVDFALFVVEDLQEGEHPFALKLDALEVIEESDDANNEYDDTFEVSGLMPDLFIDWVDVTSDGETTVYEVTVSNWGDVEAPGFWIDIWFDRATEPVDCFTDADSDEWVWVASLDAGDEYVWEVEIDDGPSEFGSWNTWVLVDTCGDVDELWEDDNSFELTVLQD